MNMEIKEKLIEMVREHECIYNTKHRHYKNVHYKSLLWEQIGTALGIQGSKAKDTWRCLRDGYMRHKKTVKGQTGSARKYSSYSWSSQMSFLDGSLELRPTGSNIITSLESLDPPQSPLPEPAESPPSPLIHPPQSPPTPETQQSTQQSTETQQSPSQPSSRSRALSTPRTTKRKTDSDTGQDDTGRVLDYLRNKKKREWDSVDYLFMSYATTFKQLSVRKQGKIKVELAKLFADAELDELENIATFNVNSDTQSSSPVTIAYLSPQYSVISDVDDSTDLTQPIFLTESSNQQEPTQVDNEAIDLTNFQN